MTTATPELQGERQLSLPPLTRFQRILTFAYIGIVSFVAGGFVYGVYFMVFDAIYKLPSWLSFLPYSNHVFTLSNIWNNWPTQTRLAQTLAFIHIGSQGGFGTWFVSQWPAIQHVYLQSWPIGVLGAAFIGLVLNRGAGKKITGFDKLTLKLHDVFGVIPSRLQEEATTPAQYIFMGPLMLVFAIPGAVLFSVADLGGLALLHHAGVGGFFPHLLASTPIQIIGLGFFSHQFFANKVTTRPAQDMQEFFEDRAMGRAQDAISAICDHRDGKIGMFDAITKATDGGKHIQVSRWSPPNYARILEAKLKLLVTGDLTFRPRSNAAKWTMPIAITVGVLITIVGLYLKFFFPSHGGLYL